MFGLLTGVDLGKLNAQGFEMQQRDKERQEEEAKKREAERRKKEEEKKKQEEEEWRANLPPEELQAIERKDRADALRGQGNKAYQAKKFEEALELYKEALEFNRSDLSVYTNMAAVYLEQKDPEKALERCDAAIKVY